jgi:hypothetical protein
MAVPEELGGLIGVTDVNRPDLGSNCALADVHVEAGLQTRLD